MADKRQPYEEKRDMEAQKLLLNLVNSLSETRQEVIALSSFFPSEYQTENLLSQEGLIEVGRRLRNLQAYLFEYVERLDDFREDYLEKDVMRRQYTQQNLQKISS